MKKPLLTHPLSLNLLLVTTFHPNYPIIIEYVCIQFCKLAHNFLGACSTHIIDNVKILTEVKAYYIHYMPHLSVAPVHRTYDPLIEKKSFFSTFISWQRRPKGVPFLRRYIQGLQKSFSTSAQELFQWPRIVQITQYSIPNMFHMAVKRGCRGHEDSLMMEESLAASKGSFVLFQCFVFKGFNRAHQV